MKKIKRVLTLLLTVIFASLTFSMFGCNATSLDDETEYFKFDSTDMLSTYGETIENRMAEEVVLKGVNAGGYLVIEQWMTAFSNSEATGYLDHKTVSDIFMDEFGYEKALELWDCYRTNFWTEQDFINCAEMGMNCIRLPFSHFSVDPDYYNVPYIQGEQYNFTLLDDFVDTAEKYGLYTILDLHATYGSHNGQDHGGESLDYGDVVFFYDEGINYREKTIDLWVAVADHFKDNPAVAAYDMLNEPGEKGASTTTRHWEFFDDCYEAMREVDLDHIIMISSCWNGENLPNPSVYGWDNVVYQYHNYSWYDYSYNSVNDLSVSDNLASMQRKIDGVIAADHGVPNYMGEFNCYTNEESWNTTLDLFEEYNWSWTSWSYKINNPSTTYSPWGIYNTFSQTVTPDEDSYEEIIEKWSGIQTDCETTTLCTFDTGTTLFDVIKNHC